MSERYVKLPALPAVSVREGSAAEVVCALECGPWGVYSCPCCDMLLDLGAARAEETECGDEDSD